MAFVFFNPINATANNVPTRGRFSPFLFKGITFSTGGYSAEYGQALSSVLLLNTIDEPDQEKTDINVMTVGGGVGHTKIWGNQSISFNTQYINLSPYEALVPSTQGIRWNSPFESLSGETVFRSKGAKSMFKLYAGFNLSKLDIDQENINFEEYVRFQLKNNNAYVNSSYSYFFKNEWSFTAGTSVSWDKNDIEVLENTIVAQETAAHVKLKVKKVFSSRYNLSFGSEVFTTENTEQVVTPTLDEFENPFKDQLWAGFLESDIFFSNKFALKMGARFEYTTLLDEASFSPRLSFAFKSSENAQWSLAYGDFYQKPEGDILRYQNDLVSEKATHYILNYQFLKNGKTLRVEAFYKNYDHLVKFDTESPQFNSVYTNLGNGYATGLDVFWRANKSIKNLDYWISYSYLNTARNFRNFEQRATPNFAPTHSLSVVTKYWIEDLKSQVGFSYQLGSGRPYDNPNTPEFLSEKTKSFNNLSVNWAYLIDRQKILYFSVNNVLGFNNVNTYQYANTPNANGIFDRQTIRPTADSFFFVGFFWTISKDKKSNQLNTL